MNEQTAEAVKIITKELRDWSDFVHGRHKEIAEDLVRVLAEAGLLRGSEEATDA